MVAQLCPLLEHMSRPGMAQGRGRRSEYLAWNPAQTPEPCVRLLPSFLGLDGPVETNDLVTSAGQVAQGVVCILGKDDLGREEMGSSCGVRPLSMGWTEGSRYQGMNPSPAAPRYQAQSRQP